MEKDVIALLFTSLAVVLAFFSGNDGVFVVLTFDVEPDLPPLLNTSRGLSSFGEVIDFLNVERVKATFFMTSQAIESYPGIVRSIVASGHEVGSHSFNHSNLSGAGYNAIFEDVRASVELLSAFNVSAKSFRAPFNHFDNDLVAVLNDSGFKVLAGVTDSPYVFSGSGLLVLGSNPLFYPSSVYPRDWVSVFHESLRLQRNARVKVVVVGVHPWEFTGLPQGFGVYSNSSGDYTWNNFKRFIIHAKSVGAVFVTASEFYELVHD